MSFNRAQAQHARNLNRFDTNARQLKRNQAQLAEVDRRLRWFGWAPGARRLRSARAELEDADQRLRAADAGLHAADALMCEAWKITAVELIEEGL